MGHRHLFSSSQMYESDHDQNWNHVHADQPYMHMASPVATDNGPFYYPAESMPLDGVHISSIWNPPMRSNGYSSSSHNIEALHHQTDASGPSHDPFSHPSTSGTYAVVPQNYTHHASSSSYDRQPYHGVDGGFIDLAIGNIRATHKRKSPGIPPVNDTGSSSRYLSSGGPSGLPSSSDMCPEKLTVDSQNIPWDRLTIAPSYRSNGISIRGEASVRNVRSRSVLELESNHVRSHLSSNPSQSSYSSNHRIDHPVISADLPGPSSSVLSREWNHVSMPSTHGRFPGSGVGNYTHEANYLTMGSSSSDAPAEIGGYHHDFPSSRSLAVPEGFHGNSAQSTRGVRSGFSQRSSMSSRPSSSSLRLGHAGPSDDEMHIAAESYSSRHPRPAPSIGWRNSDRSGRLRASNERYRLLSEENGLHGGFSSENFMVVDRSGWYGSRNMLDRHRDMRLDIDNMSYEELLALGERIGNVNTGLSEDSMFKCLTETIYCSSDQTQEEGSCVICLEEYRDRDDVGALKSCGHDYHVRCIKKWLSMKNTCPICKAAALDDKVK